MGGLVHAVGYPDDQNGGRHDPSVWFYTGGRAYPADNRSALFFTDGLVTAIQTR
jgi:hypothetical protein